jgi:hypothetical protein
MKFKLIFLISTIFFNIAYCQKQVVEDNISFNVYNNLILNTNSYFWGKEQKFSSICSGEKSTKNISLIIHGYMGSKQLWINSLKDKYLKYRGGCVVTVNWGVYSNILNYVEIVENYWKPVANIVKHRVEMIEREGFQLQNLLIYGHSLGAWMAIDVGIEIGEGKIGYIDGTKNN